MSNHISLPNTNVQLRTQHVPLTSTAMSLPSYHRTSSTFLARPMITWRRAAPRSITAYDLSLEGRGKHYRSQGKSKLFAFIQISNSSQPRKLRTSIRHPKLHKSWQPPRPLWKVVGLSHAVSHRSVTSLSSCQLNAASHSHLQAYVWHICNAHMDIMACRMR